MTSWVRTPAELDALARSLRGAAAVAVDTEADSLHHYPGKLCLVQIAPPDGPGVLVDPLAVADLGALGDLFADPATVKVLHAADNDLAYFKRLYRFSVGALFDTAIAARFLGVTSLSLDGLLRRYLGVEPGKSRQKDDWSRRPLTADQEEYAVNDVLHLIPLRERLVADLEALGRLGWVEEECAALAALGVPDRVVDQDAYLWLKGTTDLDPRGLAALRELYRARENLALSLDRPPFMIVGNDGLVRLAALRPRDAAQVLAVPGCSPSVVRRFGDMILAAVARAESLPDSDLPVRPRRPRPSIPAAVRHRAEALREWRTAACQQFGFEPGLVLPQRLIDRLAADPPGDALALAEVDGFRRWRAGLFGEEVLKVLART
ncbi:MAG TPA: HRDC domain-containing protein [Candidatus Binatia bacterium]|nr:HRDC domain-containing protein [Candidatus Binatia bacterium]